MEWMTCLSRLPGTSKSISKDVMTPTKFQEDPTGYWNSLEERISKLLPISYSGKMTVKSLNLNKLGSGRTGLEKVEQAQLYNCHCYLRLLCYTLST